MTGVGCGPIITFIATVESHTIVLASVNVIVPFPAADQFTVIELLLFEIIVPPDTFQLQVLPETKEVLQVKV